MEDTEGNITSLEETASGLKTQVENNKGDISTLLQTVSGFDQTVSNLEGDISEINQSVEGITQRVSDAEGDISTFQQTAENLQTQITNNAGNISRLEQDAEGFKTTVSNTYVTKENAVQSTDILYYLSTSTTSLVGGEWTETAPEWTNGKYMWSKTKTTYANGSVVESDPTCIAGAKGETGNGIISTSVSYQVSTSGTSVPTGEWSDTVPMVPAGQYLWCKTEIIYTSGDPTVSYSVSKSGNDGTGVTILGSYDSEEELKQNHPTGNRGDAYIVNGNLYVWDSTQWKNVGSIQGPPGESGVGIASTEIRYQASNSGTTTPTGTWQTSIPQLSDGQYLWTRTIINYTDGTNSTSYSVSKSGTEGTGIESITSEYYLSTSKDSPTGGSWSSTAPTWSNGMYVWTRSKIVYKNPVSTEYTEPICDSSWEAVNEVKDDIDNAQQTADEAAGNAAENEERISNVESSITQLADSISMLVTDEDGNSMMEQTSDGWRFNINTITDSLEETKDAIANADSQISELDQITSNLDSLVNDITQKTAYITMSTDDTGNPCIELGKQDSPFKLRITNESIDFVQDGVKIAYITNRQLYIQSSVVTDEMKVGAGSGFIWKKRSNGNMGLRWIEGS